MRDEWYYHMRFRETMEQVTPVLTTVPPNSTLQRKDGPYSGNKHVRAEQGSRQHVAWAYARPDGGRGFGFTGAHFHWNWGHDDFRKLVLNALVWIAGLEVPPEGITSLTPSVDELEANQDYAKPAQYKPAVIFRRLQDGIRIGSPRNKRAVLAREVHGGATSFGHCMVELVMHRSDRRKSARRRKGPAHRANRQRHRACSSVSSAAGGAARGAGYPDLDRKQSRQYTGRPCVGLNGTVVGALHSAQTASNDSRGGRSPPPPPRLPPPSALRLARQSRQRFGSLVKPRSA